MPKKNPLEQGPIREILATIERSAGARLIIGDRQASEIVRGEAILEPLADRAERRGLEAIRFVADERRDPHWQELSSWSQRDQRYVVIMVSDQTDEIVGGSKDDLRFVLAIRHGRLCQLRDMEERGRYAMFNRERFEGLFRWRTVEAAVPEHDLPNGWSKLAPDPMRLLEGYPHLRIRPGFVLRAYQYFAEGNGNVVVWALPEDAPYPDPEACERLEDTFAEAPRPSGALENIMEAVEGDGTPEAYVSAAMFERDCFELGAYWHGASWATHEILFGEPAQVTKGAELRWSQEPPLVWEPTFERTRSGPTVMFHTFSGHVRQAVYRHVDRFRRGTLTSASRVVALAEGPGGYIF